MYCKAPLKRFFLDRHGKIKFKTQPRYEEKNCGSPSITYNFQMSEGACPSGQTITC